MDLNFTEASSLAVIDSKAADSAEHLSPAEYEIIRQIIYHTADFEYASLLSFSAEALSKGAAALKACTPIVVDVPEIQVSIVPRLQQTFRNPVYCSATTNSQAHGGKTKAACGLEVLASENSNSIYVIGQDEDALVTMVELIESKVIYPSLAIATAPLFLQPELKKYLKNASIPYIYLDDKGSASIASAIIKTIVNLTWQAFLHDDKVGSRK